MQTISLRRCCLFAPKSMFYLILNAGGFFDISFVQEDLSSCNGFYPPQLRLLMYVIGGREVGQVYASSIYFRHCPNKLSWPFKNSFNLISGDSFPTAPLHLAPWADQAVAKLIKVGQRGSNIWPYMVNIDLTSCKIGGVPPNVGLKIRIACPGMTK